VSFKKHLVKDLGTVILPSIFENVRYVPIPRIEVADPMADVVSCAQLLLFSRREVSNELGVLGG
jgi:hypothetical protein